MEAIQLRAQARWPQSKEQDLKNRASSESGRIALTSLSMMTGFPTEFIKKELMLDSDEISMEELRVRMGDFLQNNISDLDS
jgi:hypothetical protein